MPIGELLITGFNGLELSEDTAAFLSQAQIGGVILFSHNYDNPAQLGELINQIQECRTGLPLWISVDHEGGKVQRFTKPFTKIPSAEMIGKLNSPKLTYEISEVMAIELAAVGVNLNFCPVADILTNPKNPVMSSRTYGATEDLVTKMVTAMVRGHVTHKVQPCVKHFPGHGGTQVDSHLSLPKVNTPLELLQNRELRPFLRAFKSHCAFVMTAHILNSEIDPEYPATLSKKTIQDLLKNPLRFSPIVVSDDLEMKAITDHYGDREAPRLALEAGCDLLIYRSETAARTAYESLVKALEEDKLSPEKVLTASNRVKELKQKVLMPYEPRSVTELSAKIGKPESLALAKKIENEARAMTAQKGRV